MAVVKTNHGSYNVLVSDAAAVLDVAKELAQQLSDEGVTGGDSVVFINLIDKIAIFLRAGAG